MNYRALFDVVNKKFEPENKNMMTESEFKDALRELEEDMVITQIGHKNMPVIRLLE